MTKKKGWIKCKDKLPKNNRKVLICTKDEEYKICVAYRELDAMESAFCNEGLGYLVDEIRRERRYRESRR